MSGRLFTLPRLIAIVAAGLLVSATISLAADKPAKAKPAAKMAAKTRVLVVPDVRHQAFVFASGMLEDAGFGWRVAGSVHGYPVNLVVSQSPKPGTRVIDNGAPKITIRLVRGKGAELGQPQDRSPYGASLIRPAKHAAAR